MLNYALANTIKTGQWNGLFQRKKYKISSFGRFKDEVQDISFHDRKCSGSIELQKKIDFFSRNDDVMTNKTSSSIEDDVHIYMVNMHHAKKFYKDEGVEDGYLISVNMFSIVDVNHMMHAYDKGLDSDICEMSRMSALLSKDMNGIRHNVKDNIDNSLFYWIDQKKPVRHMMTHKNIVGFTQLTRAVAVDQKTC